MYLSSPRNTAAWMNRVPMKVMASWLLQVPSVLEGSTPREYLPGSMTPGGLAGVRMKPCESLLQVLRGHVSPRTRQSISPGWQMWPGGGAASVSTILHFLSFLGWNKWPFRDGEPVSNEIVRGGSCPKRAAAVEWLMDWCGQQPARQSLGVPSTPQSLKPDRLLACRIFLTSSASGASASPRESLAPSSSTHSLGCPPWVFWGCQAQPCTYLG